jgi:tetratricopeptide (TPR) repeat protein
LASNIYSSKGSAEIETLEYDDAILSLSQAINLNPSNPDAYFDRAIAYFESGQPELSLQDYLNQGKDILFKPYQDELYFKEFSAGFAKGGLNGIQEATTEFLPSIYNSISGVGNFLWLTIEELPRQRGRFFDDLRRWGSLRRLPPPEQIVRLDPPLKGQDCDERIVQFIVAWTEGIDPEDNSTWFAVDQSAQKIIEQAAACT